MQDEDLILSFQERCSGVDAPVYEIFLNHLQNTFGDDWIVLKALRGRIGIHHSLVPKYIQKEIINLFNCGALICLFRLLQLPRGLIHLQKYNYYIGKKGAKNLDNLMLKTSLVEQGVFNNIIQEELLT